MPITTAPLRSPSQAVLPVDEKTFQRLFEAELNRRLDLLFEQRCWVRNLPTSQAPGIVEEERKAA
jgi:hypothetical protein